MRLIVTLMSEGATSNFLPLATVIALLLIFLAILLTANEIRFQGCIDTRSEQMSIKADHPRSGVGVQECSRWPYGA